MNTLAIKNGYYILVTKTKDECIIEFGKGISEDIKKVRLKAENGFFLYFENEDKVHSKILPQSTSIEALLDIYMQNLVHELGVNPDLIYTLDENKNYTKFFKDKD